ncbi:early nodulin-like protein 3 [Cucumis melo var. makuwa]|uniref:Early nodulin-like protein 3 n=1 Tax=Cucumis melo var. makuwa TaxID=1194695 RepID=A0A5A7TX59_CUCMM|nr:early nodulin-like protein 3 [Cucumis melo var. makuwa]TYJ97715.1 early nodulin-like protein 3 [Cucumis melo var. makuwa]
MAQFCEVFPHYHFSLKGHLIGILKLHRKGYSASCEGTQFIVGGAKGWSVSMAQTYNQWAEANRFQIGDSLVFNYDAGQDSVLQVTQDDYTNCNIQSPIKQYSGGHSVFQFDKSGPHYFISGNKDNCLKNEKLVVIVLADRSNSISNQTTTPPISAPSPSPSNSTEPTPSPAPANAQKGASSPPPSGSTEINPSTPPAEELNPSPPTTGGESPSPSAGTVEINPAPPVSGPPPSVGYSIIPGSIGSFGAFVAAVFLSF